MQRENTYFGTSNKFEIFNYFKGCNHDYLIAFNGSRKEGD